MFWFLPGLRGIIEYILLMPYRILCALTGGGYTEEAWRKVLEILLREYTEREKQALQVSNRISLQRLHEIMSQNGAVKCISLCLYMFSE